ncbi:hypothetical protein PR048_029999 [Dryococelus australis]|uniref:Uncharacterized protein n=1 Tax=Dryococelus australis TaxID=614101 RepID=A0ABQ9GBM7_9NEOP|nr:hypothetical protein PR048_029999 [Dryococelus australis]
MAHLMRVAMSPLSSSRAARSQTLKKVERLDERWHVVMCACRAANVTDHGRGCSFRSIAGGGGGREPAQGWQALPRRDADETTRRLAYLSPRRCVHADNAAGAANKTSRHNKLVAFALGFAPFTALHLTSRDEVVFKVAGDPPGLPRQVTGLRSLITDFLIAGDKSGAGFPTGAKAVSEREGSGFQSQRGDEAIEGSKGDVDKYAGESNASSPTEATPSRPPPLRVRPLPSCHGGAANHPEICLYGVQRGEEGRNREEGPPKQVARVARHAEEVDASSSARTHARVHALFLPPRPPRTLSRDKEVLPLDEDVLVRRPACDWKTRGLPPLLQQHRSDSSLFHLLGRLPPPSSHHGVKEARVVAARAPSGPDGFARVLVVRCWEGGRGERGPGSPTAVRASADACARCRGSSLARRVIVRGRLRQAGGVVNVGRRVDTARNHDSRRQMGWCCCFIDANVTYSFIYVAALVSGKSRCASLAIASRVVDDYLGVLTPTSYSLLVVRVRGRGGVVVRLLASNPDEPGSIPGGISPGLSHVGIVRDDAAGQRVFSGISRFPRLFIPALLHIHLASPSLALRTSILRTRGKYHVRSESRNIIPHEQTYLSVDLQTSKCLSYHNADWRTANLLAHYSVRWSGELRGSLREIIAKPTDIGLTAAVMPGTRRCTKGKTRPKASRLLFRVGHCESAHLTFWAIKFRESEEMNSFTFALRVSEEIWAALNIEVLRARVIEVNMERRWNERAGEMGDPPRKLVDQRHRPARKPHNEGVGGDPEKTRRPAVSSGTIPKCRNPGASPPGIEHGSLRWEGSSLTTTPPQPMNTTGLERFSRKTRAANYNLNNGMAVFPALHGGVWPVSQSSVFPKPRRRLFCRLRSHVAQRRTHAQVAAGTDIRSAGAVCVIHGRQINESGEVPVADHPLYSPLANRRPHVFGDRLRNLIARDVFTLGPNCKPSLANTAPPPPPNPLRRPRRRPPVVQSAGAPPVWGVRYGASVAERLACSPPTKAIRAHSPAGSLRIVARGNRAGRCRWSACFSRGSPVTPTPSFRRCSILISITLIGSQDLDRRVADGKPTSQFSALRVEAMRELMRMTESPLALPRFQASDPGCSYSADVTLSLACEPGNSINLTRVREEQIRRSEKTFNSFRREPLRVPQLFAVEPGNVDGQRCDENPFVPSSPSLENKVEVPVCLEYLLSNARKTVVRTERFLTTGEHDRAKGHLINLVRGGRTCQPITKHPQGEGDDLFPQVQGRLQLVSFSERPLPNFTSESRDVLPGISLPRPKIRRQSPLTPTLALRMPSLRDISDRTRPSPLKVPYVQRKENTARQFRALRVGANGALVARARVTLTAAALLGRKRRKTVQAGGALNVRAMPQERDGHAGPRSRSERAIRATLTRTPSASSLLRARPPDTANPLMAGTAVLDGYTHSLYTNCLWLGLAKEVYQQHQCKHVNEPSTRKSQTLAGVRALTKVLYHDWPTRYPLHHDDNLTAPLKISVLNTVAIVFRESLDASLKTMSRRSSAVRSSAVRRPRRDVNGRLLKERRECTSTSTSRLASVLVEPRGAANRVVGRVTVGSIRACRAVSWCLRSAAHTWRTQKGPITREEPGETECTAATHERAARHTKHMRCDTTFGPRQCDVTGCRVSDTLTSTGTADCRQALSFQRMARNKRANFFFYRALTCVKKQEIAVVSGALAADVWSCSLEVCDAWRTCGLCSCIKWRVASPPPFSRSLLLGVLVASRSRDHVLDVITGQLSIKVEPGSIPDRVSLGFHLWKHSGRCYRQANFFGALSRFPPSLYSAVAPYPLHFTLTGVQDLDVKHQLQSLSSRSQFSFCSTIKFRLCSPAEEVGVERGVWGGVFTQLVLPSTESSSSTLFRTDNCISDT